MEITKLTERVGFRTDIPRTIVYRLMPMKKESKMSF